MESGQFDDRITISKPPVYVDPVYGPQPAPPGTPWDIVAARVPAQLMDDLPSKNEHTDGAVKVADRPARVRMRYTSLVLTSDMKITLHDGANASGDIDSQIAGGPAVIGRRQWLEFTVTYYSTKAAP